MGWCGASICCVTSCELLMDVEWAAVGLQRFVAVDGEREFTVVDGQVQTAIPTGSELRVGYGVPGDEVIDLYAIARAVLPTLADHSLTGLCTYFGIAAAPGVRMVALLAALTETALHLSPDLLAVLGRLLPGATGELVRGLAPRAAVTPPPAAPSPSPSPPVAPVALDDAFSDAGVLGRGFAAFEDRPGQQEMARLVARTVTGGGTLLVEAGPGTGKTFAYLVPALIYLRDHPQTRIVVSTRTKQLQEQLYFKDLPFLLPRVAPNAHAALLKGRENYLCLRQWQTLFPELAGGLDSEILPALAALAGWLFRSRTGDIEENHAFLSDPAGRRLWPRLADNPHRCVGTFCPFYSDCFSVVARRRAREANIVVVNHALLFADLATDRSILGNYDYLIVDEAHALEGAARNAFTATLSPSTLDGFLWDVHHRRGARDSGWVTRIPLAMDDPRVVRIKELVDQLRTANGRVFTHIGTALPPEPRAALPAITDFVGDGERITALLGQLTATIAAVEEELEPDVIQREGERLRGEADAVSGLYSTLFAPAEDTEVKWYEHRDSELRLHASPLAVDEIIAASLYPHLRGLVLTSATLSLSGGFDYVERTLGLKDAPAPVNHAVVPNPFSYRDKMRVYLPTFLPAVNGESADYAAALVAMIEEIAAQIQRKTLVLFTSYRLLNAVHARLAGKVTAQGIDGPRAKLIERFRGSDGGAVLLGTDSFWEGVDFPGKDLEILIITRLPFPVPTDPITAAMSARIAAVGRDPFYELAVPQAVLKFRQGVGRLIRTRTDRGAVIITDRRVVEKGYGKVFLSSLPVGAQAVGTGEELLSRLTAWFAASD